MRFRNRRAGVVGPTCALAAAVLVLEGCVPCTHAFTLSGHSGNVWDVKFSPDGERIVTTGDDRTTRVWSAKTGEALFTLSTNTGTRQAWMVHSPDNVLVVTTSFCGETAYVWDAKTGQQLGVLKGRHLSHTSDCRQFATTGPENTARIWDAVTGTCVRVLEGHRDAVVFAAYSPDGELLVTGSDDKTARVWEPRTGKCLRVLEGHEASVAPVAFTRDGRYIVSASEDGTARVWGPTTGHCVAVLSGHGGQVFWLTRSYDGKMVGTVASGESCVRVWNVETGQLLGVLDTGFEEPISRALFSPGDGVIIVEDIVGNCHILGTDCYTRLASIAMEFHQGFSPSGDVFITSQNSEEKLPPSENVARIRDTRTGRWLGVLRGHTAFVLDCAFSPDGNLVATSSEDGTARVYARAR